MATNRKLTPRERRRAKLIGVAVGLAILPGSCCVYGAFVDFLADPSYAPRLLWYFIRRVLTPPW